MPYTGHRPILPGQNTNEWTHNVTGEVGVYSNWQLQTETHLLEDMPREDHTPGTGRHPHGVLLSQMYTGEHTYSPMELAKYSHGGQRAAYLRFEHLAPERVPAAEVFQSDFGHDGTREFTFSRFFNYGQLAIDSQYALKGGHAKRAYGEGAANMGPSNPYDHNRVGDDALAGAGRSYGDGRYGFEKVNEYNGVPSAKVL